MPRNGSGVYTAPQNSWNPAVNGAQALPADWMAILQDLVAAMTQSTSADGQTVITGVWNFGNNRITGVGAPVGTGNALRWEQMIKGADIASDTTISIPIEGSIFDVTGTTTITMINDTFPGRAVFLRFLDAVTINNSTGLKTPTGRNETTRAGDFLILVNTESGVWEIVFWPRLASTDFSGTTEPVTTWPYMPWLDENEDPPVIRRRNKNDTDWADDAARIKAAPAADTGDVVTFEQAFGVGQGLVGYTIGAQRSANTVYTNTTGKRITVIVYGAAAGGTEQGIIGYIGDTAQYPCASGFRSTVGVLGVNFDVPDGLSYKITASASLDFWLEIR